MHSIPKDYRSLLRTPRHIEISPVSGGQLWYNGIKTNLQRIFSKLDEDIHVALNVNVDGIPLFKSSQRCFWPILASIHGSYLMKINVNCQMNWTCSCSMLGMPHIQPMVIAIWNGTSKPNDVNEYLRKFVDELNEILEFGVTINNKHIDVYLRCFICDTPARSFLKGLKKFN